MSTSQRRCYGGLVLCFSLKSISVLWVPASDDGTGPEKIAHIMGPPDRCEHAARIINDLLQSLRVGDTGLCGQQLVGAEGGWPGPTRGVQGPGWLSVFTPSPPCLAEWTPRPSRGSWHAPGGPGARKGPRQLGPPWWRDDLLHPHSQVWAGHRPR